VNTDGAGEVAAEIDGSGGRALAVELDVTDRGGGFPPELGGREFERFARGEDARGRDGAGLGLAIVRSIAEAHGGRASTVAGPVTTVRIWIPDGQAPPPVSGPSQPEGLPARP
jgi:signal transduction histidine kinase